MKRLNPNTNKTFNYGDIREDGYIFTGYTKKVKKDGYFTECWSDPNKLKKRISSRKVIHDKKRINPDTGKIYKMGDKVGNKIFRIHYPTIDKDGYHKLSFFTKKEYEEYKEKSIATNSLYRSRAKRKKVNPATGNYGRKEKETRMVFIL